MQFRKIIIAVVAILNPLSACSARDEGYVINAEKGTVAQIEIGMTAEQISSTGLPYEVRIENIEGDEYQIIDVYLREKIILNCLFDLENRLHMIKIKSEEIRDEYGLGVGSSYGELKSSYPSGRLIIGFADGRYANFLTGTKLIFSFDVSKIDEFCFQKLDNCSLEDDITVHELSLGRYAPR